MYQRSMTDVETRYAEIENLDCWCSIWLRAIQVLHRESISHKIRLQPTRLNTKEFCQKQQHNKDHNICYSHLKSMTSLEYKPGKELITADSLLGMYALDSGSGHNSDEELSYTGHLAKTTLPVSNEKLQQILQTHLHHLNGRLPWNQEFHF